MTTKSKSNNILIRADNLTKTFKVGTGTFTALRDATFEIPEGSFTIIYGPSGSGKSTLLHILMGLDAPTSGRVSYGGKDLYGMSPAERAHFRAHTMGIVQQTDHWVKSLSVIDNVALPMEFMGVHREAALDAALASLKRIDIERLADKYPSTLSGGEQQRAAMARALVNNPSYIVADEPTGNLDSENGDNLIKLLIYLNKELQRTVVLVTHNLEYLPIADQILALEDGVVTEMKHTSAGNIVNRLLADTKKRIEVWSRQ